jgi:hypothetical protein
MKRVFAHHSANEANGRKYKKESNAQNDPSVDESEHMSDFHPAYE